MQMNLLVECVSIHKILRQQSDSISLSPKSKDPYNESLYEYIDSHDSQKPLSPLKTMTKSVGEKSETIGQYNGSHKNHEPMDKDMARYNVQSLIKPWTDLTQSTPSK